MKLPAKSVVLMVAILFYFSSSGFSQETEYKDTEKSNLIQAAKEIISGAGSCALITVDELVRPRVREMDVLPLENDFTVWLGTNPKSRKVNQIKNDPRVTLYYQDKDDSGYVMIHGKAQLIDDLREKEIHWKVEWEAFYRN